MGGIFYRAEFEIKPVPPFRLDYTVWALRRNPVNTTDGWDGTKVYSSPFSGWVTTTASASTGLLLWPATGWMEARRLTAVKQVAAHAVLSVGFVLVWYGLLWVWIALENGIASAERARANWFIWQLEFGMLAYAAAAGRCKRAGLS